jgi:hypothetical protein
VASGVPLNDDFSAIAIFVAGYGRFDKPSNFSTGAGTQDDTFYILLPEPPDVDSSVHPVWYITSNSSLKAKDGSKLVVSKAPPPYGPDASGEQSLDRSPPLFAYTMAVAGGSQIFIRFTEPVERPGGGVLLPTDFSCSAGPISSLTRVTSMGNGTSELTLTLSGFLSAANLLTPATVSTVGQLQDQASAPNPMPAALTSHRVSDLALGLPANGICEPMWAHDQTQRVLTSEVGLISLGGFDGAHWLRRGQDISLQGHLITPPAAPPAGATHLVFDVDVPSSLLNAAGLWLPPFEDRLPLGGFSGMVPTDSGGDASARTLSEAGPAPTNVQLRNFTIPAAQSGQKDGGLLQFFFRLPAGPGTLLGARVADPAAPDWYRHVTPWALVLHDIRPQRGGVAVLNNVINPDRGEVVTVQYSQGKGGSVTITVFELSGNVITVLARNASQGAGDYACVWDGKNRGGRCVARGLYFIKVVGPDIDEIRKVLIVR